MIKTLYNTINMMYDSIRYNNIAIANSKWGQIYGKSTS